MTNPGDLMTSLERQLKPYRQDGSVPSYAAMPADGLARDEVAALVERLAGAEEPRWRDGYASGAVYHGDHGHIAFLNRIYAAQSQTNPMRSCTGGCSPSSSGSTSATAGRTLA